jgi:hypothetical protein
MSSAAAAGDEMAREPELVAPDKSASGVVCHHFPALSWYW